MTTYNFTTSTDTNAVSTGHDFPYKQSIHETQPFYLRNVINFANNNMDAGNGDVAQVLDIPAGTTVLDCWVRVITAETAGATCNLGYGSDTNYWGNAIKLDATGIAPTLIEASSAWDVGSIADGNEAVTEITVDSAILGDYVTEVSSSLDVVDLTVRAHVTATDTVTAQIENSTGAAIDVGTPTIKVVVDKAPLRGQPINFASADTIDMVCNSSPTDTDWDALKVEVVAKCVKEVDNL